MSGYAGVENEAMRQALIEESNKLSAWLPKMRGMDVPHSKTVTTHVKNHADACATWLMETLGVRDFGLWVESLPMTQRAEFDNHILPYLIAVEHGYTASVYDMVDASLEGRSFHEVFDTLPLKELIDHMDCMMVDTDKSPQILTHQVRPRFVDPLKRRMLNPDLYVQIYQRPPLSDLKDVINGAYYRWCPEDRVIQALSAYLSSLSEGIADKMRPKLAVEIFSHSPLMCPELRKFLTGRYELTLDECSKRAAEVMDDVAWGRDPRSLQFLVEAAQACPEYRSEILIHDLVDLFNSKLVNRKNQVTTDVISRGFSGVCKALDLTQHEINAIPFRILKLHTLGRIRDLEKQPAVIGLAPMIQTAASRQFNQEIGNLNASLMCEMIKISDHETLVSAVEGDDKLKGFMYKLTNDTRFLKDIESSQVRDDCFSTDLGL